MIQAATLNALPVADRPHNTWFYDRATDGSGIPQNGYTSTVNAGNLGLSLRARRTSPWNQPGAAVDERPGNSQTPTSDRQLQRDDNETLANGVAWDRLEQGSVRDLGGAVPSATTLPTPQPAAANEPPGSHRTRW